MSQQSRIQTANARQFKQIALQWLAILLVALIWLLAQSPFTLAQEADKPAENLKGRLNYTDNAYRVGPGDVLSVYVYNQADLTQEDILVRDDGHAAFNGVGEAFIAGKSVKEITDQLTERISELVIDPRVTVSITRFKPGTIYLTGAVMKPGMYQLVTSPEGGVDTPRSNDGVTNTGADLRLSSVLANAGGVTLSADISHVQVKQRETGEVKTVDLWKLVKEGDASEDFYLQSGDSVYVPERTASLNDHDYNTLLRSSIGPNSFPVRVIGEVEEPGVYSLSATSPYLNSAIASAKGFKPGANRGTIAIRRLSDDQQTFSTMITDPTKGDIVLKPNDVVFIAESKLFKTGRYMETVSKIFSPLNVFTLPLLILRN